MRSTFILLLIFIIPLIIFSQSEISSLDCAFDSMHHSKLNSDPSYQKNVVKGESEWYKSQSSDQVEQSSASITLPVVFHIIHQNGSENLSDPQVINALDHLNQSFANTGYYNPNTGVNTEIQFCLAQRDPDGNTTNGITRTSSPLTNIDADIDDSNLKDLSRWSPTSYINIWVVKEICRGSSCSVAGYAYLPAAHGRSFDGIVLEADYVGSSQAKTTVLTHEMGHYLGLYHTFQGGCENNDCLQDGDKICDTPPDNTTAYTACDGSMNSCSSDEDDPSGNNPFRSVALGGLGDQDDLFENYMDYSKLNCYDQFTSDQKDRMHYIINSTRSSLLNSLSCLTPCENEVSASIGNILNEVPMGSNVSFINNSMNATQYTWYINGVSFSNNTEPSYDFNDEGYFSIVLEASNNDGNCKSAYDTLEVIVICPTTSEFSYSSNGLTITAVNESENHHTNIWTIRDKDGLELYSTLSFDFDYELPSSGWYQLCLDVEGDNCNKRKCQYIYLSGKNEKSNCYINSSKIIYDENFDFIDIKMIHSQDKSIYISGVRGNEYFLSKYSQSGDEIWHKVLPLFSNNSGQKRLYSLFEDSDGNLLMAGLIGGSVGTIIKFDAFDLKVLWSKTVVDPSIKTYSIFESNDGLNYLLAGHADNCIEAFYAEIDKSSGFIYNLRTYNLNQCLGFFGGIKSGNTLYLCGRYSLSNRSDSYRPGVSSLNIDGTENWTKTYFYNNSRDTRFYNFDICEASGGLLVAGAGDHNGTSLESFLPHLYFIDNQGSLIWSKTYNIDQGERQFIYDIQTHSSGYYLIGDYNNVNSQSSDLLVINVNQSGDVNWAKGFSFQGHNDNTLQDFNAKSQNATVIDGDTLLLTINSGNSIFWTKVAQSGITSEECNLFEDISIQVNSGPFYEAAHNFIPTNRSPNTSSDYQPTQDFSIQYEPLCAFPDISLRIDSVNCASNQNLIAEINVEICNLGIIPYSGHLPISIYDSNPTTSSNIANLIYTDSVFVNLEVDSCVYLTLPVLNKSHSNGNFFVVINNDNTIPPTFNLEEGFPETDNKECLYINNLDSFTFNYTVKSLDLGPDISICDNKPFTFNAGAGFDTYQWNDASTDSILTAARSGTYWVTAIDECGVPYSDTVQLNYETPTQVEIGSDTTICFGDSLTLDPTNPFSNYNWFPDEVFSCSSCPNVTFAPDSTITVILTVESDPGCFSSDSIQIEVESPLQINDSVNLCKGDTINYLGHSISDSGRYTISTDQCDTIVNLHAHYKKILSKEIDLGQDIFSCDDTTVTFIAPSGFDSYRWNTNSSDSIITTSEEGEYWVLAKDECGATYSDTVQLKYNNAPPIDFERNKTICSGESLSLNAPSGYATYNWTPSELIECSTCQNTSITPDSTVTVNLFVQTDSGCVSSDSITIEVNYKHEIRDTLSFCKGDSIIYQNQTINEPGIYEFQFGGHCDTTLFLIVNEIDISPVINELNPSFLQGLQNLSGNQYNINLDLNREEWNVVWSPSGNFTCDTCLSTSILPFEDERILSLKLTHSSGCVYFKEFPVNWTDQSTIYIPNIFTPNGDGVNDTWTVTPAPAVDHIVNAKIYSRWGGLIREWRNVKELNWDGKVKGQYLNPGVFIYVLTYATVEGKEYTRKGDFTLMR